MKSASHTDGLMVVTLQGVNQAGLTLAGFLFLHAMFIEMGRLETVWAVLRTYGYNNDLRLSDEVLSELNFSLPPDQVVLWKDYVHAYCIHKETALVSARNEMRLVEWTCPHYTFKQDTNDCDPSIALCTIVFVEAVQAAPELQNSFESVKLPIAKAPDKSTVQAAQFAPWPLSEKSDIPFGLWCVTNIMAVFLLTQLFFALVCRCLR